MAFQRMTHSQLDFSQNAVMNDTILTTTALEVSLSEGSSSSLLNVFSGSSGLKSGAVYLCEDAYLGSVSSYRRVILLIVLLRSLA